MITVTRFTEQRSIYWNNSINGHLSARKYTTERVEQFMRKGLHLQEVCFYDAIQQSPRATSLKKRKTEKGNIRPLRKSPVSWVICWKIPWEAWGILVPFNNYPTSNLYICGKFYQPKTNYHFSNCFIELWNAKVSTCAPSSTRTGCTRTDTPWAPTRVFVSNFS